MGTEKILKKLMLGKYKVLALDADNTLYDIKDPKSIYDQVTGELNLCLDDSITVLYNKLKVLSKNKNLSYMYISKPFWFALLSIIDFACKDERSIKSVESIVESLERGYYLYREFVEKLLDSINPSPIGKALPRLSKKFKIIVVSEEEKSLLIEKLSSIQALSHVDHIISSSDVGILKPNEKYFDLLLDITRVDKKEILYVDDKEENVVFARNYGIDSISRNEFEKLLEFF